MAPVPIRLATRPYDGALPLLAGEVTMPGVELHPLVDTNVARIFGRLYSGEAEVSEMSLAELVYYVSRDQADFVAVPVFPSRAFRHSCLFGNVRAGVQGPNDLSGRRLGFQRWVQTAAVWMRGLLVEEYGVDPRTTHWVVAATHHWDDERHEVIEPRDGSVIERFRHPLVSGAATAHRALAVGEVDVMGVTEVQTPELLADPRVRRLFADAPAAERAYYQRTGIFPIMHVLGVRRAVVEAHPAFPVHLFAAYVRSKRIARERQAALPSWSLAWKDQYLEDEWALFAGDLWPFGLEANRHVLATFLGYCDQQGISARPLTPDELFSPSTRGLAEGDIARA